MNIQHSYSAVIIQSIDHLLQLVAASPDFWENYWTYFPGLISLELSIEEEQPADVTNASTLFVIRIHAGNEHLSDSTSLQWISFVNEWYY